MIKNLNKVKVICAAQGYSDPNEQWHNLNEETIQHCRQSWEAVERVYKAYHGPDRASNEAIDMSMRQILSVLKLKLGENSPTISDIDLCVDFIDSRLVGSCHANLLRDSHARVDDVLLSLNQIKTRYVNNENEYRQILRHGIPSQLNTKEHMIMLQTYSDQDQIYTAQINELQRRRGTVRESMARQNCAPSGGSIVWQQATATQTPTTPHGTMSVSALHSPMVARVTGGLPHGAKCPPGECSFYHQRYGVTSRCVACGHCKVCKYDRPDGPCEECWLRAFEVLTYRPRHEPIQFSMPTLVSEAKQNANEPPDNNGHNSDDSTISNNGSNNNNNGNNNNNNENDNNNNENDNNNNENDGNNNENSDDGDDGDDEDSRKLRELLDVKKLGEVHPRLKAICGFFQQAMSLPNTKEWAMYAANKLNLALRKNSETMQQKLTEFKNDSTQKMERYMEVCFVFSLLCFYIYIFNF